ncbi:unnamed protein product [Polarella glacialis]|uniref:Endonuclease/exonuclease/phosphatase domain-containing protein n=1 Tax=Polarella glacialis TaxID=89957 RepID=A0A813HHS2_POLGL|nr:unnamed protein product [Polarella glacialis]
MKWRNQYGGGGRQFLRALALGIAATSVWPTTTRPSYASSGGSVFWRVASYNAQALTTQRSLADILGELHTAHILGLQGTGLRQRVQLPREVYQQLEAGFITYHFLTAKGVGLSGSCGVSVSLRADRFSEATFRQLFLPPPEFQGRVGGVRHRLDGAFDVAAFSLYLPLAGTVATGDDYQARLLDWIGQTIAALPSRTLPLVCVDGNAHVGFVYDRAGRTWNLSPADDAVGWQSPAVQNVNGFLLRAFCNHHGLALANTHSEQGHGPTYNSPQGSRTRIDYIVAPKDLLGDVIRCRVWYASGFSLQLAHANRLMDHSPLMLDFAYRCWFNSTEAQGPTIDAQAATRVLQQPSGRQRREFREQLDQATERACAAVVEQATSSGAVDQLWHLLNSVLAQQASEAFPRRQTQRFQYSDNTKQQIKQCYDLRKTLWHSFLRFGQQPPEELRVTLQTQTAYATTLRRQEKRQWLSDLANQLKAASAAGDSRQVWILARRLAQTGFGRKNRRQGYVTTNSPSLDAWQAYLEQPGPAGGCSATVAHFSTEAPLDIPSIAMAEGARYAEDSVAFQLGNHTFEDYDDFYKCLLRAKSFRACPRWSVPREAWILALHPSNNESLFQLMFRKLFES